MACPYAWTPACAGVWSFYIFANQTRVNSPLPCGGACLASFAGRRGSKVNRQPSLLGRGCRAPAFSSAGARRVRGYFRHEPNFSCPLAQASYARPARLPTQRLPELRRDRTDAERTAWYLLRGRKLGAKFCRQCPLENWGVDFYCCEHRLAIALAGGVHSLPSQVRKDAAREDYLRTTRLRLLRIGNGLVTRDPPGFLREGQEAIACGHEETPHPSRDGR